jgi:hypothetical protein
VTTPIVPDPTLPELIERFKNIVLSLKGLMRMVDDLAAFTARKTAAGFQTDPYNLTADQAAFVILAATELGTLNAVARGKQALPVAHDFTSVVGQFTGLD